MATATVAGTSLNELSETQLEITERADDVWTRGPGQSPAIKTQRKNALKGSGSRGRVAIVDACRTPFVKAGAEFKDMDVIDLASVPAAELVQRDKR